MNPGRRNMTEKSESAMQIQKLVRPWRLGAEVSCVCSAGFAGCGCSGSLISFDFYQKIFPPAMVNSRW
jgi:hypothetical protein